jgi:polysaccharide deacetylase family protein (PEP-CTERM system associated)
MAFAGEIDRERNAPGVAGTAADILVRTLANAFSVDVEDYFQVEAFKGVVDRKSWETRPSRVEANTDRVLGILDAAGVRATFFVLGWVAERFPKLVLRLQAHGHELASHGYGHELASEQGRDSFRQDVRRAKAVLEDCAGVRVRGFRAPTFSIGRENWWAYEILAEEGYAYSSSIYPVAHDLYGTPDAPRTPFRPVPRGGFVEIPIATARRFGRNRPCGGGGYFRLRPYALSRRYIDRVNRADGMACVFYCHPWEFDPAQPRFRDAPLKSRLRHYLNLGAMEARVSRLLREFAWGRIDEIFCPALDAPMKTTIAWTP